jgi:RimJ/RimL family protein N-acetyltransferase
MIILETERLFIRNWQDSDSDLIFEINSDETVMEFFPMRRTRMEAEALFFDVIQPMIAETGLGFYALERKETGEPIGFCGLARVDHLEPHVAKGSVEIGWRLAARYWGKGFVTEAAEALLKHAFETLGLPEIVSFAVHDNRRSTAVMERIGMSRVDGGDFDHPRVPDSHPHLQRHVLYRLTQPQWQARRQDS